MKKLNKLLLAVFLFGGMFLVAPEKTLSQELIEGEGLTGGASDCSIIGNNLATPNKRGQENSIFREADYTLILFTRDWSNIGDIIEAIKEGNNIIVRLGSNRSGYEPLDVTQDYEKIRTEAATEAQEYIAKIQEIRTATGDKPFIVTAGHNEPNCAEFIPRAIETKFIATVAATNIDNVTWISGQIDFYCGVEKDGSPETWISEISRISGIDGIALPFYIGDVGPKSEVIPKFNNAIDAAGGKSIYVTESGPLKSSGVAPSEKEFLDYASGIKEIVEAGRTTAILLFNSPFLNDDIRFRFTKPFQEFLHLGN